MHGYFPVFIDMLEMGEQGRVKGVQIQTSIGEGSHRHNERSWTSVELWFHPRKIPQVSVLCMTECQETCHSKHSHHEAPQDWVVIYNWYITFPYSTLALKNKVVVALSRFGYKVIQLGAEGEGLRLKWNWPLAGLWQSVTFLTFQTVIFESEYMHCWSLPKGMPFLILFKLPWG